MRTRASKAIAPALLAAAGVGFAWLGWRTVGLERSEAAARDRRRAEESLAALERAGPPAAAAAGVAWVEAEVDADPVAAASESDRLLLDEAAYRERARGDLEGALSLLERLAGAEPKTPFSRIAALRGGIVARRLGRLEPARALLRSAAEAPPGLGDPAGPLVRPAALRHLAAMGVEEGGAAAETEALLVEAEDGRRLRADRGLDAGDALLALAGDAASAARPLDAGLRARLDAAVATARRGHRLAAAAPAQGAALAGGFVAWREGGRLLAVEAAEVGRLWPAIEASYDVRLRAVATTDAVPPGAVFERLPGVVEGAWIAAAPRSPSTAGAAWVPVVAGLLVYALGAALAWASIARQARVARMQTDFVAAVSHEMKTPIASVQAMAERLADGAVASPAKALDYAERIHAEMLRLGASVRNVLDASRIERVGGRAVVRLAPAEPSAVVADVAEAVRPALERRGYSFDVETSPARAPLPVDPEALRSVLTNLLDNAAKFSADRREVSVRAGPNGAGGFRIEVLDRGPGVPAAERERVFERFYRGDGARRGAVPGLGLGLHVARELVLAHGGSLTVSEREGGGAVFVVDLPEAA